ncbi:MAG: FixH family protein [Maricaulaceae bacterium]
MMNAQPRAFRVTGRFVLIAMLAFFGVVIGVIAVFITVATRTFSGVVSETAYEDGLNYDAALAERRAQAALDWRFAIQATPRDAESRSTVSVVVTDAEGAPAPVQNVRLRLSRPVSRDQDQSMALSQGPDGVWRVRTVLEPGAWDASVTAQRAGVTPPQTLEVTRRLRLD